MLQSIFDVFGEVTIHHDNVITYLVVRQIGPCMKLNGELICWISCENLHWHGSFVDRPNIETKGSNGNNLLVEW
jgi:hypothetical protein